jgi:hypothetical protein
MAAVIFKFRPFLLQFFLQVWQKIWNTGQYVRAKHERQTCACRLAQIRSACRHALAFAERSLSVTLLPPKLAAFAYVLDAPPDTAGLLFSATAKFDIKMVDFVEKM